MTEITNPLRLAVGSHEAGSGKGCAMNVISWESGDLTITDMPACADPMLARLVQKANDDHCTHRDGDLLCPSCSVAVLALAHRVAGTAYHDLGPEALHRVWVTIAVEQAESVAHLNPDPRVAGAIAAVRDWLAGEANQQDCITAAHAAYNAYACAVCDASVHAAYDAPVYAAHAATNAADATYATNAAYAATNAACATHADAYAADATANAAYATHAALAESLLARAHEAIDRFYQLTGLTEGWQPPVPTDQAIERMLA